MIRDCVAFKAGFPDDAQWDGRGRLIVPRGKTILNSLAGALAKKGCPGDQVRQHGAQGWGMEINREGIGFGCLLQSKESLMLLAVTPRPSLLVKLFQGKRVSRVHGEVLEAIGKVLGGDTRFSEVRFLAREELGS
jgi:hypothetical protein